jgi:hypothetical protein
MKEVQVKIMPDEEIKLEESKKDCCYEHKEVELNSCVTCQITCQ